MDVFSFITLFGGLSFFLYGMHIMSQGLEKLAGSKFESILKKMTSNPLKSFLLGVIVTGAIQSSSAVTVMLVGFVNSGIMQISQTIGVIMGANIGTTVTAWLLSLVGVKGDNIVVQFIKPENFSLVFALIGILLIMLSKREKHKDIGSILIGFAVLMFGMKMMSGAVEPLKEMPEFTSLMTAFSNPILGVLAGAVITGIIQSSSASVGILQAIALTGSITYSSAIPIIMGQNIGTCVTSLISSIGVSKNAKKVAVIHISFNLIGTIVFMGIFYLVNAIVGFSFIDKAIDPVGIAVVHTAFNMATTLLLMPFTKMLEKIANFVIRDSKSDVQVDEQDMVIDERLLATPSIAIAECDRITTDMSLIAENTINKAVDFVFKYDNKQIDKILEMEDQLDKMEDKLGTYIIKISNKGLSEPDNHKKFKMLHVIGDFERIGDHAVNLVKVGKEINEKKVVFSEQATKELEVVTNAIKDIVSITTKAYISGDEELAMQVEPLEQVIDGLIKTVKARHISRLEQGECTMQIGFILSDLLTNYERVSDHCSNIAVAIVEVARNEFDTHEYLNSIKNFTNSEFNEKFNEYSIKYYV